MYEELNYAELEEWRDGLLQACVGTSYDDPNFEVNRKWIESISTEMERREEIAAKRLKLCVCAINILVLAVILFVAGCQTAKGFMGDSAWLIQKGADNIQVKEK